MNEVMNEKLACPECQGDVVLDGESIVCSLCGRLGRYVEGVWDLVSQDTYAETFGRQWTLFPETQLDSKNGTHISADQFERVTGWSREDLDGKDVLDAGCGAGRYVEIALSRGARVTGLDLSQAAYVCRRNIDSASLTVVRGDLLSPPLKASSFDRVFSIGVVQSTPDPLEAARQLARLVRPGGELMIWMYSRRWYTPFLVRTLIWRVTRHLSPEVVLRLCEVLVFLFTPIARVVGLVPNPRVRRVARSLLPIASYRGELPLNERQQREWSLLDTHDWLSPAYDLPQNFESMRNTLLEAGLCDVRQLPVPGLSISATRPRI